MARWSRRTGPRGPLVAPHWAAGPAGRAALGRGARWFAPTGPRAHWPRPRFRRSALLGGTAE